MCFNKTKESKLLIAKRDITVYKIGDYADEVIFNPYYITMYNYRRKTPVYEYVKFHENPIKIGLHSLLSLQGIYDCVAGDMLFFPNGNLHPFIIPKDSIYMVNSYNEVISNRLIYTGKFKYIYKNENFNVKELWKENQVRYLSIKVKLTK